ncbi:MAG: dynamin family protein [Desulfamplus sp.]|nr:dynamin family protein [Desulfamplus sp.]
MIRSISLVGTTSSGKSTIGNLLSGHYILPTGVQETTVSVIEIFNNVNYCVPTLTFIHNKEILSETPFKHDSDIRTCISNTMLSSESESIHMRLNVSMNVFNTTWQESLWNRRKLSLKRQPIPEELGYFKYFLIRDFPGFQHEQDINRVGLIKQHLDTKGIILFVFNAEETDSFKEDNLLQFLFNLLCEHAYGWESVFFVLNRADAFYRDNNPEHALEQALNNRQKRIKNIISDIWRNTSKSKIDVEITPISAGIAFASEMLCWYRNFLSKKDFNYLQNKIENEAIILLPDNIRETLPRSASYWDSIQWEQVNQTIYYKSGLAQLINRLRVRC